MKTSSSKKIVINIDPPEQQENVKNTRKTLKVLQQGADKENLVGRSIIDTKLESSEKLETKRKKYVNKAVQTGEATVTSADLTFEEPSADYWKLLAEKRQESLDESLQENERLKGHIDALKEENKICKEMLEESKHLVEVLQEMLGEEDTAGVAEEATENATPE